MRRELMGIKYSTFFLSWMWMWCLEQEVTAKDGEAESQVLGDFSAMCDS